MFERNFHFLLNPFLLNWLIISSLVMLLAVPFLVMIEIMVKDREVRAPVVPISQKSHKEELDQESPKKKAA